MHACILTAATVDRRGPPGHAMSTENSHSAIVQSNRIVALQTPVELGSKPAHHHRIELQRDGDRIVAIHVFCRCGEQIVLDCEIASPPAAAST